jgi:osmotically-inducible protein OsmY
MTTLKTKSILYGLLLVSSIQFAECKSKNKENNTTTTQSGTVDSGSSTVAPPAPVEIAPDETLQTGLRDATKDYPDVKASVNNGEVTLTGNITRDRLPALMQSINSLQPKKINNNLTIK